MPKGALLHAHVDATVDANFVISLAIKQPAIHVRVSNSVNASTIKSTLPEFRALPEEQFTETPSLTCASYLPNTWVQFRRARENFDPRLGGAAGFDKWVLNAMTVNPAEAYGTHNTVTKVRTNTTGHVYHDSHICRFGRNSHLHFLFLK